MSSVLCPFNGVFFICLAIFVLFAVVSKLIMGKKSEKARSIYIAVVYIIGFICFFIYKYYLSIDTEYSVLCEEAGVGAFSWWLELPIQLCNINLMLIPVACLTGFRPLKSFCFFLAPLGAAMALIMPSTGFSGYSIFLPRMLGFYGTHFLVFIGGPLICLLGLYRPKFKDMLPTALTVTAMLVIVTAINYIMRLTGINPYANYFYSIDTAGISILELFYSWIPVPFLYMAPAAVILAVYMLLVTTPFELIDRANAKKEQAR